MKRASKPPTPPQPSVRDEPSRSGRARADVVGRPPPLPTAARSPAPFPGTPGRRQAEGPDPITEDLGKDEIETHRPPAPTITLVPTPAIDWSPNPEPEQRRPPSSHNMPTAPKRPPSDRSMEAALREQMWSNLQPKPTHTAQTGPHLPVQMPRGFAPGPPTSSSSLMSSPTSTASGSYRTISEQREGSVPRSDRTPASADDGWPLGYIVASAFFLAIAVVGFSLWLALEVISL